VHPFASCDCGCVAVHADRRPCVHGGSVEHKVSAMFTSSSVGQSVSSEIHHPGCPVQHASLCIVGTDSPGASLALLGRIHCPICSSFYMTMIPIYIPWIDFCYLAGGGEVGGGMARYINGSP